MEMTMNAPQTTEQQLRRAHTTTDRETLIEHGLLWRAADEFRSQQERCDKLSDENARLTDALAAVTRERDAANVAIWSAYSDLHTHVYLDDGRGRAHAAYHTLLNAYLVIREKDATSQPASPTPPPADTDAGAHVKCTACGCTEFVHRWSSEHSDYYACAECNLPSYRPFDYRTHGGSK
jgi:hypothetical protein